MNEGNKSENIVHEEEATTSKVDQYKNHIKRLFENKKIQLGLVALLVATIPLTVIQGLTRQDNRQRAATVTAYKLADGSSVTSLAEFQTKIKTNAKTLVDGTPRDKGQAADHWPIGMEDYLLCPAITYNTPGSPDIPSLKKDLTEFGSYFAGSSITVEKFLANPQQVITGDLANGQKKTSSSPSLRDSASDPWYNWGDFVNSTDKNDIFFTDSPANSPARLRGDAEILNRAAHCRDRGCAYYAVWGPDNAWAGGFKYSHSQDSTCYPISTWDCARSGWSRVMGFAQRSINQIYNEKGKLIDRRCALAVAVTEVSSECSSGNETCKNASDIGFSIDTTASRSVSGGSTPVSAISNGQDDQASCKNIDKSFNDVTTSDSCLAKAVAALSTEAACTARGYGEGKFAPTNPVTREEFIAFLTRYHVYVAKDWNYISVLDTKVLTDAELFSDVPRAHPQALNIYTAAKNGFTDVAAKSAYNPSGEWKYGFKGITKADYTFSKEETTITRGDVAIGLYNYGVSKKQLQGEACAGAAGASPAPRKDPTPFVEVESDKDNRVKVCGEKPSLLSGHITAEPSVRLFKEDLYLFVKGREDALYVRKLTPKVTTEGLLANLTSSPWVNLNKSVGTGDIITYLQNLEGLPSLSVIVTGKEEKKALISSTTGTTWTPWIESKSFTNQMQSLRFVSTSDMTFSFKMGDESSENNICMTIVAVPAGAAGSNPGTVPATPSTSTPSTTPANTSPVPSSSQAEPWDTCYNRESKLTDAGSAQKTCCAKYPESYKNITACNPEAPLPEPGTALRTAENQNPLQSFWSWITGLFN